MQDKKFQYGLEFGSRSADDFDKVYAEFIAADIKKAQAHLDELPENQRRGLSLETLRHFGCGYLPLPQWTLTKSRAEFVCGKYTTKDGEIKKLPPPSERIIIPTPSMSHYNAVATPRARKGMGKDFCKQHAGKMELFCDADALQADTIVVVEGEIDCMSIWQATQGKIPVVAILGCSNSSKTLGVRLRGDFKDKRFVLLLDADAPGKKAADKLRDALIRERVPAVIRYLYNYLPLEDKKPPQAVHVDASEILQDHSERYLKEVLNKTLATVNAELDSIAAQIAEDIAAAGTEDAGADFKVVGTARETNNTGNPGDKTSRTNSKVAKSSTSARRACSCEVIEFDPKATEEGLTIKNALKYIRASKLTRDEWFSVGCVMKRYGFDLADFDKWSNDGDERYSEASCRQQWNSMKTAEDLQADEGYKIGTLINIAITHSKAYAFRHSIFKGDKTDDDFAHRLELFDGDRVRWLTDSERWLIYDNGVWTRASEKNSCVLPLARALADFMSKHVVTEKEYKLAACLKATNKKNNTITALKGFESILIKATDLDTHDNLLNVRNGVVDLETGKLMLADPSLLITRQCRADFDPNANSGLVLKFFSDIMPDEQTRAGLLRWLGYCLTGLTLAEKFAVMKGGGGNGKGVLSTTMIELLGDYAATLNPRALLSKRFDDADRATTSLNVLEGVRFAISEELPADAELDISLIKNLTGGDRIALRKNYSEYRTIDNHAKISISGNYLPRIENVNDDGLLRRLINFPFNVKFGTSEHPADHNLKMKMLQPENLRGLLTILVREAGAFYREGLIISPLMERATKEHLAQNNFVAEFIADFYTTKNPKAEVKAKDFIDDLKAAYPAECRRFKRADLIKMIEAVAGITYCDDRTKSRIFKGIGKLADATLAGTPINPADVPDF